MFIHDPHLLNYFWGLNTTGDGLNASETAFMLKLIMPESSRCLDKVNSTLCHLEFHNRKPAGYKSNT